jgi:hypothetical protein
MIANDILLPRPDCLGTGHMTLGKCSLYKVTMILIHDGTAPGQCHALTSISTYLIPGMLFGT